MKASVAIVAYNHEQYIAQAVDSALRQKVDFDYEIVIGEDCSTDRTREILIGLQQRFPDKIRLLLNPSNVGAAENVARTICECRGEYVAFFDGDDYWTSPHKLQRQVAVMDAHPEWAMCFNAVKVIDDAGAEFDQFPPGRKSIYTIRDLLQGNFVSSCSSLFRNGLVSRLPSWHHGESGTIGDWARNVLLATHGDVGYIDEILSAYRRHGGGEWSPRNGVEQHEAVIRTSELLDAELNFRYSDAIRRRIARSHAKIAVALARQGDGEHARGHMIKAVAGAPLTRAVYRDFLVLLLRLYLPRMVPHLITLRNLI